MSTMFTLYILLFLLLAVGVAIVVCSAFKTVKFESTAQQDADNTCYHVVHKMRLDGDYSEADKDKLIELLWHQLDWTLRNPPGTPVPYWVHHSTPIYKDIMLECWKELQEYLGEQNSDQ